MKKFRFIPAIALFVGMSVAAYAGNPKEEKGSSNQPEESATTSGAVVKWFHFNGDATDPSEMAEPTNYTPESSPQCESTSAAYRCDIYILSQEANQNLPDLSQTVQQERKRATP